MINSPWNEHEENRYPDMERRLRRADIRPYQCAVLSLGRKFFSIEQIVLENSCTKVMTFLCSEDIKTYLESRYDVYSEINSDKRYDYSEEIKKIAKSYKGKIKKIEIFMYNVLSYIDESKLIKIPYDIYLTNSNIHSEIISVNLVLKSNEIKQVVLLKRNAPITAIDSNEVHTKNIFDNNLENVIKQIKK